jgi:HPt (histidine-containing phosphotransfer) domain-containing protein
MSRSTDEVTIDEAVFEELRTFGDDFLIGLLDQFVHYTDPQLVELSDALEAGDHAAVGRIAHSMKGSSGQLGGQRLSVCCGRLEESATAGHMSNGPDDLEEVETEYKELCRAWSQALSATK